MKNLSHKTTVYLYSPLQIRQRLILVFKMQPPDPIACTFSMSTPEPDGRIDPICGQGQGTHLPLDSSSTCE